MSTVLVCVYHMQELHHCAESRLPARSLPALCTNALQVPQIIFCGDQVPGKLRLMQDLCEINLPWGRARLCPLEVRMRRARPRQGSWSCEVAIRLEHIRLDNAPLSAPWVHDMHSLALIACRRHSAGLGTTSDVPVMVTNPQDVVDAVRAACDVILQTGAPCLFLHVWAGTLLFEPQCHTFALACCQFS
jgi:hypothetical protein